MENLRIEDSLKATFEFVEAWKRELEKTRLAIDKLIKAFKRIDARCGLKPRKYYRTSVAPKWSNRTRRKQRLTRLQRRHKRQRK